MDVTPPSPGRREGARGVLDVLPPPASPASAGPRPPIGVGPRSRPATIGVRARPRGAWLYEGEYAPRSRSFWRARLPRPESAGRPHSWAARGSARGGGGSIAAGRWRGWGHRRGARRGAGCAGGGACLVGCAGRLLPARSQGEGAEGCREDLCIHVCFLRKVSRRGQEGCPTAARVLPLAWHA